VFGAPEPRSPLKSACATPDFFKHVALFGNVGFGESYVHGDWDTDDIAAVIAWFIASLVKAQGSRASSTKVAGLNLLKTWNRILHKLRPNSLTNSRRNIQPSTTTSETSSTLSGWTRR
jgi:cyclopropane-fatty-acyl-phospholipid synthase